MTKISNIQVDHYRIPLPTVLSDATHGDQSHFAVITVRLTCDDGSEGMGYTYTVGNIGGAATTVMIERDLAPLLMGADPSRIEQIWEQMWWRLHDVGRGGIASFAISAVDIALWDLRARRADLPLWRLLGGHDPQVRAYAGGIDLMFSLDDLLAQADGFIEQGFRAIKMKVGREDIARDVERVAAMRAKLGDGFPLLVDANMKWNVEQAIRASRMMAEYDIFWLEEPTIPDDIAGHVRILREGALPIATGENLHMLHEFEHLISAGGVSFPEPDVTNCGGITVWMKVAHLAQAHNLPVTSHGVHDLHVHLLAAIPNDSLLEAHGFGLERWIEHPLQIVEGHATAPERPGHGIAFDWDVLEEHRDRG